LILYNRSLFHEIIRGETIKKMDYPNPVMNAGGKFRIRSRMGNGSRAASGARSSKDGK